MSVSAYFKNKRLFGSLLILFMLGGAAVYWQVFKKSDIENGRYILQNNVIKEHIQFARSQNIIWDANNYVSIAAAGDDYYVLANYGKLFLLNEKTNQLCTITPIGLEKLTPLYLDKKIIYNPTGVFVDKLNNLYVANYKGNNILQGKINSQLCEVTFVKTFSSTHTGGPENVSVDNRNNVLVSANYDAGTVTAFHLDNATEWWSTDVPQAHGVAISGNEVFVTGLMERKIYKLRLTDGAMLEAKGSIGWDPMKSQFLWPTSIAPYDENQLIIADAHTGFISFLDKKSLQTIRYMGGNGPSYEWFNYPYAVYPTDKQIILLSSMRGNILFLDYLGKTVIKNLISKDDHWPKLNYENYLFGKGWDQYCHINGEKLIIRAQAYTLGYGRLCPVITTSPVLRMPDMGALYNLGPYIYFVQGYGTNHINIIFSSSSTTLLTVMNKNNYPDVLLENQIKLDSWLYDKKLIDAYGTLLSEKDLAIQIELKANQAYKHLDAHGWIQASALYELGHFSDLSQKLSYEEFLKKLAAVFQSPIGERFKFVYDQCNLETCDIKQLREAARDYYLKAHSYELDLSEYTLVGMLSGLPPEK